MRIFNTSLIDAAVDLDESWTSNPIWLGHISQYSVQLTVTGTPTGTFKLQASCDEGIKNANSPHIGSGITNWTDITSKSVNITTDGSSVISDADAGYAWVRIIWTPDGGGSTGSVTSARINGKGV